MMDEPGTTRHGQSLKLEDDDAVWVAQRLAQVAERMRGYLCGSLWRPDCGLHRGLLGGKTRMPGHASSLRKHDRKADDERERTGEFPLAGTKSSLFKFEIKKGKDKGGRKRQNQSEKDGRSMAGLQCKCRQARQLGAWACWAGEWMGESGEELAYLGRTHHGWAVGMGCPDGTAPSGTQAVTQQLRNHHSGGSHNKTESPDPFWAPKPARGDFHWVPLPWGPRGAGKDCSSIQVG